MIAHIESLNQKMSLGDRSVSFSVSIKLPNGEVIEASMDQANAEKVISASLNGSSEEPEQAEETPAFSVDDEQPEVEEKKIHWPMLPSHILPEAIKDVMTQAGVPEHLTANDLRTVADEVSERLAVKAEVPKPQESKKPAGTLRRPMIEASRVPPRRTVATNENGYPVAPRAAQRQTDPEADEDGVSQL